MADPHQLSFAELIWVALLAALMLREFYLALTSARFVDFFKPTLVLAVVLFYYVFAGPFWVLATGDWFERLFNRRSVMVFGWAGAAAFYLSTLVGFYGFSAPRFAHRFQPSSDPASFYRLGTRLCQIGLALFSVVAGFGLFSLINPFTARSSNVNVFGGDGLANYFLLSINFLIPGLCLLFVGCVLTRQRWIAFALWSVVAIGIFVTLGFRFRLILIAVPLLIIWYLLRRQKPNFAIIGILALALIFSSGYIGLTRSYGRGLDASALEGVANEEIFAEGFGESSVFLTTSGMIAITPDSNPYVGIQPLLSVLQFPIPRALFPGKDTFGYLERSIGNLFGNSFFGSGAAILCYGEWFLISGWSSLVLLSVAFGFGLRCLWNWFLIRQGEPLAMVCYAVTVSYIYVVVSRGYLAQVVAGAAFTVAPLFWLYYRQAKFIKPIATPSAPPLPRR